MCFPDSGNAETETTGFIFAGYLERVLKLNLIPQLE
jgi:hypothetical protein